MMPAVNLLQHVTEINRFSSSSLNWQAEETADGMVRLSCALADSRVASPPITWKLPVQSGALAGKGALTSSSGGSSVEAVVEKSYGAEGQRRDRNNSVPGSPPLSSLSSSFAASFGVGNESKRWDSPSRYGSASSSSSRYLLELVDCDTREMAGKGGSICDAMICVLVCRPSDAEKDDQSPSLEISAWLCYCRIARAMDGGQSRLAFVPARILHGGIAEGWPLRIPLLQQGGSIEGRDPFLRLKRCIRDSYSREEEKEGDYNNASLPLSPSAASSPPPPSSPSSSSSPSPSPLLVVSISPDTRLKLVQEIAEVAGPHFSARVATTRLEKLRGGLAKGLGEGGGATTSPFRVSSKPTESAGVDSSKGTADITFLPSSSATSLLPSSSSSTYFLSSLLINAPASQWGNDDSFKLTSTVPLGYLSAPNFSVSSSSGPQQSTAVSATATADSPPSRILSFPAGPVNAAFSSPPPPSVPEELKALIASMAQASTPLAASGGGANTIVEESKKSDRGDAAGSSIQTASAVNLPPFAATAAIAAVPSPAVDASNSEVETVSVFLPPLRSTISSLSPTTTPADGSTPSADRGIVALHPELAEFARGSTLAYEATALSDAHVLRLSSSSTSTSTLEEELASRAKVSGGIAEVLRHLCNVSVDESGPTGDAVPPLGTVSIGNMTSTSSVSVDQSISAPRLLTPHATYNESSSNSSSSERPETFDFSKPNVSRLSLSQSFAAAFSEITSSSSQVTLRASSLLLAHSKNASNSSNSSCDKGDSSVINIGSPSLLTASSPMAPSNTSASVPQSTAAFESPVSASIASATAKDLQVSSSSAASPPSTGADAIAGTLRAALKQYLLAKVRLQKISSSLMAGGGVKSSSHSRPSEEEEVEEDTTIETTLAELDVNEARQALLNKVNGADQWSLLPESVKAELASFRAQQ